MKRLAIGLVCSVLLGLALQSAPANAQPEVPAEPQITDPLNDSNFLNDQGVWIQNVCDPSPCEGDHVTPADAGSVSDFLAIWFTNTADQVSVHIQTQLPPPASSTIFFSVYTNSAENPADEPFGCLRMRAIFGGVTQGQRISTYRGDDFAEIVDVCADTDPVDGEFTIEEGPDGTGITTLTFPRSASPLLAPGGVLKAPWAAARIAAGIDRANYRTTAQSDNTMRGTDYALQDETAKPKKCPKKKAKKNKCPKPAGSPTPTGSPGSPGPTATASQLVDSDSGRPWLVTRAWSWTTQVLRSVFTL